MTSNQAQTVHSAGHWEVNPLANSLNTGTNFQADQQKTNWKNQNDLFPCETETYRASMTGGMITCVDVSCFYDHTKRNFIRLCVYWKYQSLVNISRVLISNKCEWVNAVEHGNCYIIAQDKDKKNVSSFVEQKI